MERGNTFLKGNIQSAYIYILLRLKIKELYQLL